MLNGTEKITCEIGNLRMCVECERKSVILTLQPDSYKKVKSIEIRSLVNPQIFVIKN